MNGDLHKQNNEILFNGQHHVSDFPVNSPPPGGTSNRTIMFVFVRNTGSPRLEVFGPATPAECRAWIRLKGLHPRQIAFDYAYQIASPEEDIQETDWAPMQGIRHRNMDMGSKRSLPSNRNEKPPSGHGRA